METILKLRQIIVISILLGMLNNVEAQKKGSFRFGLDIGYALPSGGETLSSNIEAKYNLTNKSNIGIRLGGGPRYSIENADISKKEWSYYSVTYDNYFHKKGSSLASFLGAGLGIYKITGFNEVTQSGILLWVPFELTTTQEVSDESKIGFMVRGGVELGKIRLTLEYNIVPKTEFEGGEIKNNYVGISIGFYLGGGKWK